MAAAGLEPEDFEDEEACYWPDTAQAFHLFTRIDTQWRCGFRGATGLDYSALYPLLDRQTRTSEEWEALFDDIRAMEAAALEVIHENDDAPDSGQGED